MDMIFGEGPILTGNWYNPKTGDSFTVRDTYFEDNNFYIMTTDGRRLDYDIVSQYVQSDKPIPKMEQPKPQSKTQIPQEVLSQMENNNADNFMTDEDKALIWGGEVQQPTNTISLQAPGQLVNGESEDEMLVRRILKRSTTPYVDCKVNWKSFPIKQMEMLDMMAVDVDTIVDYYIKDIDLEKLIEIVKEGIRIYIEKSMYIKDQIEEKPVKEKPTKAGTTNKPSKTTNKTKENKKK